MRTRTSSTLLGMSLLASLFAFGSGCARPAPQMAHEEATAVHAPGAQVAERNAARAPSDEPVFAGMGEAPPRPAALLKSVGSKQARPEEDDEVRWSDCSRGAKVCTAKGFVYDKVSPAMPDINAHAAPLAGR